MKRVFSLKQKEIQVVLQSGQIIKTLAIICYFVKTKELKSKYAVAVSKKIKPVAKKNKVRRQIRAVLHQFIVNLNNYHLVFIAKSNYFAYSFPEIAGFVLNIIQKIQKQ